MRTCVCMHIWYNMIYIYILYIYIYTYISVRIHIHRIFPPKISQILEDGSAANGPVAFWSHVGSASTIRWVKRCQEVWFRDVQSRAKAGTHFSSCFYMDQDHTTWDIGDIWYICSTYILFIFICFHLQVIWISWETTCRL